MARLGARDLELQPDPHIDPLLGRGGKIDDLAWNLDGLVTTGRHADSDAVATAASELRLLNGEPDPLGRYIPKDTSVGRFGRTPDLKACASLEGDAAKSALFVHGEGRSV